MKSILVFSVLALIAFIQPATSEAAAARGETREEQVIKKAVQKLAKNDLKFVTREVSRVCGTNEPGTEVQVQIAAPSGRLVTIKTYQVTYDGIFTSGKIHDCSVEK